MGVGSKNPSGGDIQAMPILALFLDNLSTAISLFMKKSGRSTWLSNLMYICIFRYLVRGSQNLYILTYRYAKKMHKSGSHGPPVPTPIAAICLAYILCQICKLVKGLTCKLAIIFQISLMGVVKLEY